MSLSSEMPVAILAGGMATRLRPVTERIPKSLVPVAGRPFLAHQIELLRSQGVRRLVLCVGHLGEMIQREFGDGSQFGVSLDYSFDGPQLLGTGGAVRKALPLLGPKFFVLYGDSYLPINYSAVAEAFVASGRPALMTVYANAGRYDTSNVWFHNGQIQVYDKQNLRPEMRHIDYGLSAFDASVFSLECGDLSPLSPSATRRARADALPADIRFDLADLLRDLAARGQLAGYEVAARFYEIGSSSGLAELDALLRTKHSTLNSQPSTNT